MIKVGTLTFHRACNNGAVLQAQALVDALNNIPEVEAEIIDYRCEKIDYAYTPQFCFYNCNPIKGAIKFLLRAKSIEDRNVRFNIFRNKYLKISDDEYDRNSINEASNRYDLVICGSDQIWNYELTGNDEVYLLGFLNGAEKKASYAVSFGLTKIDQAHKKIYRALIGDIQDISVREEEASSLVKALTGKSSCVHIDPVFLKSREQWEKMVQNISRKRYVLIYMVGMGNIVDEMVQFAQKLAQIHGLDLLFMNTEYIPYLYPKVEHVKDASPNQFLSYIYNADYIVTNSFHATCFAIIFQKCFYTEVAGKKGGRAIHLLKMCGLESHIIKKGLKDYPDEKKDNWYNVEQILKREKKRSIDYLEEVIRQRDCRK